MAKPVTRKIEQAAVNCISDLISRCPHLVPYLDSNDKTPFTDGRIDIHNISSSENVGTHSGQVFVQIKGTTRKFKGKKFSIGREYLSAYLNHSGVLFFVVVMDNDLQNRKAYYCNLSPFKIHSILQSIPEKQKTVSIKLKACPTTPEDIERIVKYSFETTRENTAASAAAEYVSTDEFFLRSPEKIDLSKPQVLNRLEDDYSLEVKLPDGNSVPIDMEIEITPAEYCYHEIEHSISSGDVTFNKFYRRRIDDENVEIKLSKRLWFLIKDPAKNEPLKLNLMLQGSLGDCLNDLRFYMSFINDSNLNIDGKVQKYQMGRVDKKNKIYECLDYLEKLAFVLSDLGVRNLDLIDLESITKQQHDDLSRLYSLTVRNELSASSYGQIMRYRQAVGKWVIEMILMPDESDGNKAHRVSLFSEKSPQHFVAVSEEEDVYYFVTPFDIIDADIFPYVINLPLENISKYYDNIKKYRDAFHLATMMILRLISSADLVPSRKEAFLASAFELNEWLILESGEEFYYLINRWQIIKRQNGFNKEIKMQIRELMLDPSMSILNRLACAILLEDIDGADFLFGKLSQSEQHDFREWPIGKLYEDLR